MKSSFDFRPNNPFSTSSISPSTVVYRFIHGANGTSAHTVESNLESLLGKLRETRRAVIVGPHGASQWQGLSDVQALVNLAGAVDVILLGTGAEIAHIPAALKDAVERAGMGVEPMISPSACRSYNVLASEGRRVALAALPV